MKIKIKLTRAANYNHYGVAPNTIYTLDMEEYLYGVVPSECKASWSLETLKAQAIAARSYAIVKYNRTGCLDDTVNNQAFIVTNKTTRTSQAVDQTAGQVLTYNHSVAECVFSASNGGRCVSAEAKWGNRIPYLIAKDDPWTAATGKRKDGHGVGLSQWGAYYAGSIGKNHIDILNFYYPHTVLVSNYGNGGVTPPSGGNVGKTGTVVVNSAGLNVRNAPGGALLNYKLYNGEQVQILEEQFSDGYMWYRVLDQNNRSDGWVRSDFITLNEGGSSSGNVGKTGTVVVNSAGLNVRNAPGGALLNYKLYNGEQVRILEEQFSDGYTWYRVLDQNNRSDGWVRSDFISIN